ncbi:hypothetical protein BDK51DRAFT_34285, partial [Blyttiomyces helicus]
MITPLPLKESRDRYATDLADEGGSLIQDAAPPLASWRRSSGGTVAPSAEPEANGSQGAAVSSRRDSYATTPRATPFRSTPGADGADLSLHGMLVEARNECLSLRALNVRLLTSNEELRTRLGVFSDAFVDHEVGYEKERADSEFDQELARRIEGIKREAAERQEDLQQARRSLAARARHPETEDIGVQHDAVSPLVRDLRAELRDKDTVISRMQEELQQLFGSEDLGSSRGSGSSVDIAGADAISRLLERCRRHVHSSNDAFRRLRADLEERDHRAATIREDAANAVLHEVSTTRRELEAKHHQALDSLRTAHAREIATISNAHDATLAALRRDLDAALARPAVSPHTATIESLQSLYPSQFAQLAQSNASRIATLEADHAIALDTVRDRAEASVRDAVSRSHREAARFKEQFTAAYHTAIARLKDKYMRLAEAKEEEHKREMQDMAELNRREVDEAVREGIEKGRREAEDAAAAAVRRWGEDREEVDRLRERIAELEDTLTQTKLAHNQALLDTKHRSAKDLQESLQRMKTRYIETLQTMRDDLARHKSAAKQRFDAEWIRREAEIDRRWIA